MSDLRPMSFGEVLDGAFTMYRRHFGLFMKLSAVTWGLPAALLLYLRLRFSGTTPDQSLAIFQTHLPELIILGLVWLVAIVVATVMLTAGSIRVISSAYLGGASTFGDAVRLAASKIVPLVLVGLGKGLLLLIIWIVGFVAWALLVSIANLFGGASAVLVGVLGLGALFWFLAFVLCGYALTTPVVVLEELASSFDAFGRSWDLTRGFKLKAFGLWLVVWILTWLVPFCFFFGVGYVVQTKAPGLELAVSVVNSLVSIALAPVLPCMLTLFYYDLRMRREGFDLQVLGQQLGIG
ncbi:MAG TPA: hypothetical protein VF890_06290 [Gemmatimonadales bacterium]